MYPLEEAKTLGERLSGVTVETVTVVIKVDSAAQGAVFYGGGITQRDRKGKREEDFLYAIVLSVSDRGDWR